MIWMNPQLKIIISFLVGNDNAMTLSQCNKLVFCESHKTVLHWMTFLILTYLSHVTKVCHMPFDTWMLILLILFLFLNLLISTKKIPNTTTFLYSKLSCKIIITASAMATGSAFLCGSNFSCDQPKWLLQLYWWKPPNPGNTNKLARYAARGRGDNIAGCVCHSAVTTALKLIY